MECENCENELKATDTFCESCGTKVSSDNNLIISRPGKFAGAAVALHITIDDMEFDLRAGEEKGLRLANGAHVVKYKIWCRREHEVTVNIEDNKVCSIIFKYDALWGGFKVAKNSVL